MQADTRFQRAYMQLASPAVIKFVARVTWQWCQHKVQKLMLGACGESWLAGRGVIGMIFEQHGHIQMPVGLAVHMRKLMPTTEKRKAPPAMTTSRVCPNRSSMEPDLAGSNAVGSGGGDDCQDAHASDEDDTCAIWGEQLGDDNDMREPTSHHCGDQAMHVGDAIGGFMQVGSWDCTGVSTMPSDQEVHLRKVQHKWDAPGLDISGMDNLYLQPPGANNPTFDAYYSSSSNEGKHRLLLQYTVNGHHGVRAQHVIKFLQRLSEPDRKLVTMVFVVPTAHAERYLKFSWQPWLGHQGEVRPRNAMASCLVTLDFIS